MLKMLAFLPQLRKDKLLGSGVVIGGIRIVAVGFSFLFMKAVTYISGAEGWGLYTLAYTGAYLAVSTARLGIDTTLLKTLGQAVARDQFHRIHSALKQSTLAVLGVSLILSMLLWITAPFIAKQIGKPPLENYTRIAALWVPFWSLLFLFTESLRGLGRNIEFQSLQTLLPFALGSFLLLPFAFDYIPAYTPDTGLVAYGIGLACSMFLALFVLARALKSGKGSEAQSKFPLFLLLRTALPILSTNLFVVGLGMVDVLLLGYLSPDARDIGVYSVALRISFLMLMPLQAFGSISATGIAGLHDQRDHATLESTLVHTGRLIRLTTVPLWAIVCLASPFIMIFFGNGFKDGWPILIILASNQFFNALCGPIDVLLQMTGKERVYRNLLALGLVVNIIGNALLIPHWGIWGAAIAHSITMITWNLYGVFLIKRAYGIWLLRLW